MKIAVLLTCHNRSTKTNNCLRSLLAAQDRYNTDSLAEERVVADYYLVDDGCTDDTISVVRDLFPDERFLHILRGDGNLFWAGGMRFCWREAMKRHEEWDYYLLINDDVEIMENLFYELINTNLWIEQKFHQPGIVSGITCSSGDHSKRTYGGRVWANRLFAKTRPILPNGEPQLCTFTNANIMLVPRAIVDQIGIFYGGYQHGYADYDYSCMARKKGIPVIVTAHFCGICDNDHVDKRGVATKVISMNLKERKAYFKHPLHSSRDYLSYVRRNMPIRYPISLLGGFINLYFPKLYYQIDRIR